MKNRRLSSRRIYQGSILNLRLDEVEQPDGRRTQREIIEHPGAAVIVPIDREGRLHLVRQYRDAAGETLLELPAGKLRPGEDPVECARRELREELGLTAGRMEHLASFYSSPGFCDEIMHVYLARDLTQGQQEMDRGEFIEPETREMEELDSLLQELRDAKSLAGILLARRFLE
ncbi:ADP-ribose pyrophosphatase [bacterium BMS3Abin01]|nr:ADP-ribose pyrophosphatase [bacterium BMS3Abin01]